MQLANNTLLFSQRGWRRSVYALVSLAVFVSCFQFPHASAQEAAATGDTVVSEPTVKQVSYLQKAASSLGWFFGLVFLGLSLSLVALFVMNLITARKENVIPSTLVEGFEKELDAKQYQQAYDLAKSDESFLGHVLSAGLSKVSVGYTQAIEAMQEVGEVENMRMEHRLSYLALIGSLSPMIGLLGTVSGMISSFKIIANTTAGAPNPQDLAEGISTALYTTLVGLALAIPALAAYNLLRNKMARLVLEVGIVSEGLMSRFQKQPTQP
ncbi:MotA/TolQ/ExbB proton channel family protein [Bythopirellula goksoeyrii]|uniref:Biopolymer transport protein ExbB n=1 Tax=Bythopirellula goksoeyrii TaxID=1400387 RepID=A0A5B9Q6I3_9BACT|nr:MotA/TolQ/ExbB proton channel family protein [Bythopirellula goksoeyrii]QEG33032.1 Biopolymer transport protein ExbB [Bythopirellula goksoeyrii]